mmetsp:Transcript_8019/g.19718  ORF Transcript_8019/g.19718 Transcript_8019/m.19718 type:complete len:279 (+) Transcript_8019:1737-2573(+)
MVDILATEKKLSRKIRFFNTIHICHGNMTLGSASDTHQGPVFEHFTPNRSGSNNEIIQVQQLLLDFLSIAGNLRIVSCAIVLRGNLVDGQQFFRKSFVGIQKEKSVNGRKLSTACLEHFLPNDTSKGGTHGTQDGLGTRSKVEDDTLLGCRKSIFSGFCHSSAYNIDDLFAGINVSRRRQFSVVSRAVFFQGLKGLVEQWRTIPFGKVGHHAFSEVGQSLFVGLKGNRDGLLHLGNVSLLGFSGNSNVSVGSNLDFEHVRSRDLHLIVFVGLQSRKVL